MKQPDFDPSMNYAIMSDNQDELASYCKEFVIDDQDEHQLRLIYMDGNSLGRLPKRTIMVVEDLVRGQWGRNLVNGWGRNWFAAPQRIGEKIARLIGANNGQVVTCDSTSVNLYKLVMAALSLRPGRVKIISDSFNFPSDLYILQGCIKTLGKGHHLNIITSNDMIKPDLEALYSSIDETTALVTLSHVVFKSGFLYDAAKVTSRAHEVGALILWDLSHSVGAVPIALDNWGADLAIGCTYKYLNGGPGAPAFLYVNKNLISLTTSPIWGWFGQNSPFTFEIDYRPNEGINRFQVGTPPVLSLLAMEPGIDILFEAGIDKLRSKSLRQTNYMINLFDYYLAQHGFQLGTPREDEQRGSHISIRHQEGYRINRALIEDMHVLPDFREPDNIRFGIAPLYTRYVDIYEAILRTVQVINEGLYKKYPTERKLIT